MEVAVTTYRYVSMCWSVCMRWGGRERECVRGMEGERRSVSEREGEGEREGGNVYRHLSTYK